MKEASTHVGLINGLLKNTKFTIWSEFIYLCLDGVSITTNNILAPSNLGLIEKYIKSIDSINNNKVLWVALTVTKDMYL